MERECLLVDMHLVVTMIALVTRAPHSCASP